MSARVAEEQCAAEAVSRAEAGDCTKKRRKGMSNSRADGKQAHHDHLERGATAWHSAGAARAADDTKYICERKQASGAISYDVKPGLDGGKVHLGSFRSVAEARKARDAFLALSADDKRARLEHLPSIRKARLAEARRARLAELEQAGGEAAARLTRLRLGIEKNRRGAGINVFGSCLDQVRKKSDLLSQVLAVPHEPRESLVAPHVRKRVAMAQPRLLRADCGSFRTPRYL